MSAPDDEAVRKRSGVFEHVLSAHRGAFAHVKRLGMRHEAQLEHRGSQLEYGPSVGGCAQHVRQPCPPPARERGEMAEGYAALRAIVESERLLENEARPNDLADAMAVLDAINPGSPEWGPAFLQVSELLEAQLHEADAPSATLELDHQRQRAAS